MAKTLGVTYNPNGFDLHSRPKNAPLPALIVGESKAQLPVKDGDQTVIKEFDAVDLIVFQNNPEGPLVVHRKQIVSKDVVEKLGLTIAYYEE